MRRISSMTHNTDWRKGPFVILTSFLCLLGHLATGQTVTPESLTFSYTEDGQDLFLSSHSPSGCYADLNSYPHWCLGNLSRCDQGISVEAHIQLDSKVPPNHPAEVLLTSGGHTPNGDGFYIKRALADQYTVGVALGDNTWKATFRLISGSLVSLGLTWNESAGLKIYVDGLLMDTVASATKRVNNPDYDGSSSSLAVGVSELGYPNTHACSYSVRQVDVVNQVLGPEGFRKDYNMSNALYLGCAETNAGLYEDSYIDARTSRNISAETQCRLNCHRLGKSYAITRAAVSCACREQLNFTVTLNSPCDGQWEVYYVSHVTESHEYQLTLDAKSQSKNSYTKPNEDFLFSATLGLRNVEVIYRFEFDDGVTITTSSPPVSHSWLLEGNHYVNVTAKLGIVVIMGDIHVVVEDVDEGKPPTIVGLTVGHDATESLMVQTSVRMFEEHDVRCTLQFGDDSLSESFPIDVYGGEVSKRHNYSTCGLYDVHASCSNAYGTTNTSSLFYARELLPKFTILSSMDNFSIASFGDDNFFNNLIVTLGSDNIGFTVNGKSSVSLETSRFTAGIDNIVTIFSESVVLDRHILSVRRPVKKPQIIAEKTSDAWELTAIFTIELDVSDHIWMSIDYGNGDPIKELYIPAVQREMRLMDSAIYSSLGDYRMRVRLQNEISTSENTIDISVEVPITSLSVSTYNITSLQEQASFTFDVNMGGLPPQKVLFTVEYDDGKTSQTFYRNIDRNEFVPLNPRYRYTNWGIYRVKVTASNNISRVTEHALIHVGENITFIDILTETERIPLGGSIDFLINCPTGSDVEYFVNFGDGTNFTVGELSGPENSQHSTATAITESFIRVNHIFSSAGIYKAKVTVKNIFGSMSADLCPTLSVSSTTVSTTCTAPEVSFKDITTSLTTPLVRKRSVDTLITVVAKFDCSQNASGTNELTYSWKGVRLDSINDMNITANSSLSDYVERTIDTYCSFKITENTLAVEALDLPFGLYRLTVTVSPSDNDLVYTTEHLYIHIIQSEPVAAIEGEEFRTIMRYETAIFDISKSFDPDLEENIRLDLSYHLVFLPEASLKELKQLSMQKLLDKSDLVTERTLFPSTTSNRFAMYQYGSCFNDTDSPLTDLTAYNGKIRFHADSFSTEHYSFGILLWVERNGLASMVSQIAEVRSTNVSLDDLGSLLDLAMNADPDTAIRLLGGAASAIMNQEASSADAQEELAKSTEAVVKTLGSVASRIDSPNQGATCASTIKTMTSNKDIVSEDSRSSAAGAFVDLANGTSQMADATVEDASNFAGEALGGLGNIFPTAPEESTAPKRRSSTPEESTTTTELLGLMASRMANDTDEFGYTTPFTTRATGSTTTRPTTTTSAPTTRTTSTTTTTTTTTATSTTTTYPTTTTVITTPTTTIIHTTVGTTLAPEVKASFVDNGDNFTISGITVATLRLNASDNSRTTYQPTTTTTTMATTTTTEAQTTTPVTIPIHPMMFMPRHDARTSWEIAEDILNSLPEKKTYDELLNYIFDDCLLFRRVMKTSEIQTNCPCISAEAINMMKCDGDFSLQERVFYIMTFYEHPDDLYEAYLVPLDNARAERDRKRKETDKMVAKSGQQALGTVADQVGSKTSEEDRTERSFETPRLGMKLAKVGTNNATNGTDGSSGKQSMSMPVGNFNMPTNVLKASSGGCENVNTMFMGDTDNPYTFAQGENSVGKGVMSLGYSCNGQPVPVEAAEEPILLWMERDASAYQSSLFVLSTNTKKDVWTNFNYHSVNITDKNSSLQVVLKPTDSVAEYYVYFKVGDRPNMTHYDFIGTSPNDEATLAEGYDELNATQKEQLRYSVQIPLDMTSDNETYWIGVKIKSGNIVVEDEIVNTSYTLMHLISGCRFFDETNDTWSSEGCVIGPLTTKYQTQCFCDHLTSFGSDSAMAPNTIDFNNVWAQFDLSENAAVFSTVIVLIGIYIILLVWLRHMDKKDLKKWGALPLEDNLPTDSYHYQFTIQTGVKANAGTDSQIRFIVSGEEGDSGVRRLAVADGERKHIPRGSILNYVMSVDACLGPLTFLRIWHDNSGKGKNKSWYLDQVQINDLQTGEKFIFLCDKWLAVEQGDGMVDRILPVAGIDDLVAFKQLFSSSARKKLANDHLWLSVFSRPTRSNFTRVQRLSCCMSLLFLTMITNAMWFKGETKEEENVEAIKLGPISFTVAQFFIGFASTLIVFPPNFVMITFFRRCRQKNNAIAQVNQPEVKDKQKFRWKNVNSSSMIWGPKVKKSKLKKLKESISNILTFHKKNKYSDEIPVEDNSKDEDIVLAKPKKKKSWSLPHWCVYIAWVLCFFSIVASGFFTILYSMQWGKEKSNEWLTTFLLSFFQSVIIVQPIKVLLLVAFIACILKKPDLDEEDLDEDINKVLAGRAASSNKDAASLSQIMLQRRTDNSEFQPPDPEELEKSRKNRLMELKMEAVLKEIMIYTIFLGIIFFLSYQQRDPQSYALGDTIRKNMLSGHGNIKTVLDYWIWLEGSLLPSLYALKYFNGTEIDYWQDAACISDMESRRVGVARIRQMRVKNDTCTILPELKPIINHCRDEYSWTDDDTKPYLPYWVVPPSYMVDELEEREDDPFVYQNSFRLKTAPYVGTLATYKGGGYVILTKRLFCRTDKIITRARAQNWLDLNTRAIFLEYTVYNPNINLFASVTAVTEFLTTGSATSRVDVKVFRLMSYIGGFGLIVLIMKVFFGITVLYFFYQCVKKVRTHKWKYFNDFWSLLEFVLLCFAVTCIVLYAFKHILTEVAMRALHNRKSDGFVNFNSIALYDELYGWIMAVVVFMATIQFLKLLQFNKKMGMLGSTVKLAAKDLKVFSITFFLYFFAFTGTAFLLFGHVLMSYQSIVTAAESMFAFALGSFDYEAMTRAQPFWGPLFFFSYIGVVYIGLMSIFLTIIGDSFTTVKENVALQSNDYEIVDFMWKKIKALFN